MWLPYLTIVANGEKRLLVQLSSVFRRSNKSIDTDFQTKVQDSPSHQPPQPKIRYLLGLAESP
jgi:hypothetical protein